MSLTQTIQIASSILFFAFLAMICLLLYRLDKTGQARTTHVTEMQDLLTKVVQVNAESARISAESARQANESVHNLIALLGKQEKE